MPKTLVTGSAGFTGRHLVRLLADSGDEVHALVHRVPAEPIEGAAAVHAADLTDLASLTAVVRAVQPDRVVHLAAIAFVAHGDVEEMYRTNILGTRQLLAALAGNPAGLTAVLLASSANVYGNRAEGILDETMAPAPANDYGASKVAMEAVAAVYREQLPIIVARPFNYTGRGQSPDFLIPKIIDHARRRAPTIELGNLDVARDFSDVRMVVDCYARLLDAPAAIGGTFNVCSGEPVTLRDLLEMVRSISGHAMDVRVNPAFVRANEVRTLAGTARLLESVIGPRRRIDLRETLAWMLEE